MAQQKHKKWLYILALIVVIVPLLGVPQGVKTAFVVIAGLFVAYIAFLLPEQKKETKEEPFFVENGDMLPTESGANETRLWNEEEKTEE